MENIKKSTKLSIGLLFFIGIPTSILLGVIYQYVQRFIPFIYINAALPFLFGFYIVGYIYAYILKISKVRTLKVAFLGSFILSIFFIITSFYIAREPMIQELNQLDEFSHLTESQISQVFSISHYMDFRKDIGVSISIKNSNLFHIKGNWWILIWLVEFLMLWLGLFSKANQQIEAPFCKECYKWMTTRKIAIEKKADFEKIYEGLKNNQIALLLKPPRKEQNHKDAELTYFGHSCESCNTNHSISVRLDKKTKDGNDSKDLISNHPISKNYYDEIYSYLSI